MHVGPAIAFTDPCDNRDSYTFTMEATLDVRLENGPAAAFAFPDTDVVFAP